MAKFKVGDKVKIPKTKSVGSSTYSDFKNEIKNYKEDFLIIKSDQGFTEFLLKRGDNVEFAFCRFTESDLELYEESSSPQLEIGQWYKASSRLLKYTYYIKIKQIKDSKYYSEYICITNKVYYSEGEFYEDRYTFEKVDKNIEEIQKYLPDNHEDKQKQPNLVKGKYYSFDYYGDIYWFRFEKLENNIIYSSAYRYGYIRWEEKIANLVYLTEAKDLKEVTEQEARGIIQESPESLVGRWIKTLKSDIDGSKCKENTYYQIIEEDKYAVIIKVEYLSCRMGISISLKDQDWILMPKDFNPETENTEWILNSEFKITYNNKVFPEKPTENGEIVLKTAKKPTISVDINVKNVKYPEIKVPTNITPKKASKIILKNFNLTI